MTLDTLRDKARQLPLVPGVYIMHDKDNNIIYVGKAKKLRNRVYQYFQENAAHSPKTKLMVSKVHHFDVIIAATEFEALVLECSLIKRHLPKYNILLKDDKGYPYLRLDMKEAYPKITLVNKISNDGADYYGPYGSRGATQQVLETVYTALKLPSCSRKFPRDIGKGRPCLNYHMNQCAGWCQTSRSSEEYMQVMLQAKQLLQGNYKQVSSALKSQMLQASEELNFELAASLRDQFSAVEALGQKQIVTTGAFADTDVIGFAQTQTKACFAVLHFSSGNLVDKEYEVLPFQDEPETIVSALLKQYYLSRGFAPKDILLPFSVEDCGLFEQLLEQQFGKKTRLKVPRRGDKVRLVELAYKNAYEEVQRVTSSEERTSGTLLLLGKMLAMDPPARIEAFDISNISGTDIVASMVVFEDGKSKRSAYKRFKINDLEDQDDYAAMHQVIKRRFIHFVNADAGFEQAPDLVLIDGGITHAATAVKALDELGLCLNVFGMVKDDRHRTRALVTPDGKEISVDTQQSVFSLIGNIQEETHRFAITYHRSLRSKRLRYSQLDKIPGIGQKRKQDLLKSFKSLSAIKSATIPELERVLPKDAAAAVYYYFRGDTES